MDGKTCLSTTISRRLNDIILTILHLAKMPPKKKSNKKGNDEWEAELGETVGSIAPATQESKAAEATPNGEADDFAAGGGGLLAALKKNKSKKQKKGKVVEDDYLDGEDPPANDFDGIEFITKAPEEATTDDVFEAPTTKARGGKGKQGKADEQNHASDEEGGTLKSKKEKEKEKKEREKQRKKEQVFYIFRYYRSSHSDRS